MRYEEFAIGYLAMILCLYFLPSLISWARNHHKTGAICSLNLFLGWTVFGWIASLVWSLANRSDYENDEHAPSVPKWERDLPPRFPALEVATRRKHYVLKAELPADTIHMERYTQRAFTFRNERHAALSRQCVRIKYTDRHGQETERTIDVYCPQEDEYVFAWCHSQNEPRTFNRNRIDAWRFLDEHFDFDPLVERYFKEEGIRPKDECIPWKRWKSMLKHTTDD